jgi:hypothetical protein
LKTKLVIEIYIGIILVLSPFGSEKSESGARISFFKGDRKNLKQPSEKSAAKVHLGVMLIEPSAKTRNEKSPDDLVGPPGIAGGV